MSKGYRGMIWDRTPRVVQLALSWLKVKTVYVERVYKENVTPFKDNDVKNHNLRLALNIKNGKSINYELAHAINMGMNMKSPGEKEYWAWVEGWVKYFQKTYMIWKENYYFYETHYSEDEWLIDFINSHEEVLGAETSLSLGKFLENHFQKDLQR